MLTRPPVRGWTGSAVHRMPVYRPREGAQTLGSAAVKGTFQHRLAQATSEAPAALLHSRLGQSGPRRAVSW
jgi:hypothetical protein